jgi:hypothetical protein
MLHRRQCFVILLGFGFLHVNREPVGEFSLYFFSCITLICFYFELNIYGRLPTIPTKIVPRKKLKGRYWKDELSTLTSVSLGSSGDLLLGLQKSAVVSRNHFFEQCSFHIPLKSVQVAKKHLATDTEKFA